MAYKRDDIFKKAKKAIEKNNLLFIEDVVAFLPCGKATFYNTFPLDSHEMNTLKDMLEKNKIKTKYGIR